VSPAEGRPRVIEDVTFEGGLRTEVRHTSEDRQARGAGGPARVPPSSPPEPDFVAFVRAVRPTLERILRRLAPPGADPFDLAAEALARTYARWTTLGDVQDKRAWVLRVATNLAYDARARGLRRAQPWPSKDARQWPRAFEDEIADRELLRPALLALPRRQREAVTLRYLGDLPLAEVAKVMRVSVETAKTHVERGRAALREALGDRMPEDGDVRGESDAG
jgi:RNA polymerase sigma factor (sigma-70 family)